MSVEIDHLDIRYGRTTAVDDLSMLAKTGAITSLLGPNGAGKSSVLKALCTLLQPASGSVRVFGVDTVRRPLAVRSYLGVVFQEPTLDRELSVERNLRFHASMYGMGRAQIKRQIDSVLGLFDLADRRRDPVEQLSGGLSRRVEIARALLHEPRLLVLDEPTAGLDPDSRRRVWKDLRRLRRDRGVTILYSTHYLEEAEYSDHVVIMDSGHIVREGSPAELKTGLDASSVLLRTGDDEMARRNLREAGFRADATPDGLVVPVSQPERVIAVLVAAAQVPIVSVSVRHPSMDDVFVAATGPDGPTHPILEEQIA